MTLYKLGKRQITAYELDAALLSYGLTNEPEDAQEKRFGILGEWYCPNEECPCREVRIHAKWPDGDRPEAPTFRCPYPSCRSALKFHGHLKERTLIPEEAATVGAK